MFITLPLISYFLPFSPHLVSSPEVFQLQQSLVLLQFSLPNMVITIDVTNYHWAFYIQGSGFSSPVVAPCLVLCTRCILPCKNSRLLHSCCRKWSFSFSKVVVLHLDNITAKAYLCNEGSVASLFFPD